MLTIDERSKRLMGKITTSTTYALWFFGLGIYVPYFPIWLHDRGFDAATIGVLLAVPMVVRILATAPITRLGDSRLGARRAFLLIASGATLVYSGLFFAWGFWPIAVVLALMSVFVAPGVPLLDVIVLNGVVTYGYDYGRIRFWGSAAWLAAVVVVVDVIVEHLNHTAGSWNTHRRRHTHIILAGN
jgi:PPP family 3-phenylpropionic acid transporter